MSLIEQLKRHEGWEEKPYIDTVGVATFGYGFTYLTKDEGEFILRNRIESCRIQLDQNFPWTRRLDRVRFDVLINMCYNLGISRLKGFRKFLLAVEEGRWADAANEMLNSVWASQVKGRAVELANQMLTGVG